MATVAAAGAARANSMVCVPLQASAAIRITVTGHRFVIHGGHEHGHDAIFHRKSNTRCFRPMLTAACLPPTDSASTSNTSDVLELLSDKQLFVVGLSPRTTEKSLRYYFARFGKVIGVKITRDSRTNRSKGYGFVTYALQEDARKAIEEMDGKFLEGRVVFVELARKGSPRRRLPLPKARGPPPFY